MLPLQRLKLGGAEFPSEGAHLVRGRSAASRISKNECYLQEVEIGQVRLTEICICNVIGGTYEKSDRSSIGQVSVKEEKR